MSPINVVVPAAGESVTEADIVEWKVESGDFVNMDDPLVELETDKASMDLTAEQSGVIEIKITDGTVQVGDIIATIEPAEAGAAAPAAAPATEAASPAPSPEPVAPATAPASAAATQNAPEHYAAGHPSPAAKQALADSGMDAATVPGTGKDGRITKEDALAAISNKINTLESQGIEVEQGEAPVADTPSPSPVAQPSNAPDNSADPNTGIRREKMSRLRRTVAERLVNAQHTQALLTTFNEVDMSAIMDMRKKYKESFKDRYDVGLGFMSFFTVAVCQALAEHPIINASVDGQEIVYYDYVNMGIAVASPRGLVVPVIKNAHQKGFAQIESDILNYAKKAKDGKISLEDMEGATFTITNGGTFGSMLSTPIVNFPQSAILGMHNIVKRPVVVDDKIEIRPIMYLALSYDHRIIDGSDAVRCLVSIKQRLEDPNRLLIGV